MISVHNLTFEHKLSSGQPALRNVSLEIQDGEFVAIVGPNGSGKTTLIRHFNALNLPLSGKVLVDGMDTADPQFVHKIQSRVGMVFQNPEDQLVAMTVEEDVAFGLENLRVPSKEIRARVTEALEWTGMSKYRLTPPHQLSAGQIQRVALAGILAMQPNCIIFDEVTTMLDPAGRAMVMSLMKRLNAEGHTVIFVTHSMDEAALAHRIVVLNLGELVRDDSPVKIFSPDTNLEELGLELPQVVKIGAALRESIPDMPREILDEETLFKFITKNKATASRFKQNLKPVGPTDQSNPAIIAAEGLGHIYYKGTPLSQRALENVSFTVGAQFFAGLIGATGSGKSTLLQHLNGLLRPQEGSLRVGRFDLTDTKLNTKEVCRFAGLVFQNPDHQFFEQYVGDEIAFGARQMQVPGKIKDVVHNAMSAIGLDFDAFKDRITSTLSSGEKRKVAIASVLVFQPEVLLLDEPTAGLDPASQKTLKEILSQLSAEKRTILLSSHRMEDITELTSHATVMCSGTTIGSADTETIFSHSKVIEEAGLELPLAARVAERLRSIGWEIPQGVLTTDALLAGLNGKQAHG
jgi:energy-coupling factor transport system ATP-binding protein